ncbi:MULTISPECIES: hypothetical protein [Paenibacillus]|nr:hypothetical protein [Paenibacillus sp. JMULE4]
MLDDNGWGTSSTALFYAWAVARSAALNKDGRACMASTALVHHPIRVGIG